MTRIYVMESCLDCAQAKQLYGDNPDYEIIDIGKQARNLKEFLALRDNHPAFDKVRERRTGFTEPSTCTILSLSKQRNT